RFLSQLGQETIDAAIDQFVVMVGLEQLALAFEEVADGWSAQQDTQGSCAGQGQDQHQAVRGAVPHLDTKTSLSLVQSFDSLGAFLQGGRGEMKWAGQVRAQGQLHGQGTITACAVPQRIPRQTQLSQALNVGPGLKGMEGTGLGIGGANTEDSLLTAQ